MCCNVVLLYGLWHGIMCHDTITHDIVCYFMIWCDMICFDMKLYALFSIIKYIIDYYMILV